MKRLFLLIPVVLAVVQLIRADDFKTTNGKGIRSQSGQGRV
jgi:hypothetical protein